MKKPRVIIAGPSARRGIRGPAVAALGLALGGASLLLATASQGHDPGSAVTQLIDTDKRMQRAFVDRDVTTLKTILADDYVLVIPDGTEQTKADILHDVESGSIIWEINETSGWEVRVHGGTGIVVATLHSKGLIGGKSFDRSVKFSDVYILEGGSWRNVHAHTCLSKHLDGT